MKINEMARWWRPVGFVGNPGTPGCPQTHGAALHFKLETAHQETTHRMRRTLLAMIASTLASLAGAAGLSTTDRMFVDGISVAPKTGAVTLMLVIDLPLEDGLTKPRAKSKILSYDNWMRSKKFAEAYPEARPGAGKKLLIAHIAPMNALGVSVLSQVEDYAQELGFTTSLKLVQPVAGAK